MRVDFRLSVLRRAVAAAAVAALLGIAGASSARAETPLGHWLTEDRDAVIAVNQCGQALCGEIAGIPLSGPAEPMPTDYRNRSQCHLTIISGAAPDGREWSARITDPRDGSTYRATLKLDREGRLRVRGYIGIPLFGQTQVWTRYAGPVPSDCRLPDPIPQEETPGVSSWTQTFGGTGRPG